MLPSNRISFVIIASTLALVALVVLQVRWMIDSKALIEDQFDQKVRMALCSAVESLNRSQDPDQAQLPGCSPVEATQDGFQFTNAGNYEQSQLDSALAQALNFYEIHLSYEMDVVANNACVPGGVEQRYCCVLSPFQKQGNSDLLSIRFPGKQRYVLGKMKLILLSSIVILLFITFVFVFANHTLLRQKQIYEINKDFFNNMAHEFRTPLTNIGLANHLLVKKHQELADNKFVKVIREESQQLKHQVERVLQLARLENGEYELEKTPLDPGQLIREVIAGMALQIKEKQARVQLQADPELPLIFGDRFHLGNVFRNLIDNALKYSECHPQLQIVLRKDKAGVLILFQ
ncbi:MAG: HAMP domain-containing sensor histidine kinase, partial [Bacteroidota bacterium]